MKKFLAMILAGAMVLAFTGCNGNNNSSSESSEPISSNTSSESHNESESTPASDTSSEGNSESTPESTPESEGAATAGDAVELLNSVWETYGEDERFAVAGGDFSEENMTDGQAGTYGIEDTEALDATLGFPASEVSKIDAAASIMHMMNANTFTCGAYHVIDSADVDGIVESLSTNINARQWMCGFPDKLVIITEGSYVVAMFGHEEPINTFRDKLLAVYPTAVVAYEAPIE